MIVTLEDGRRFELEAYDPVRFGQTVVDEVARDGYFAEPNSLVVSAVTHEAIVDAVRKLFAIPSYVNSLVPLRSLADPDG